MFVFCSKIRHTMPKITLYSAGRLSTEVFSLVFQIFNFSNRLSRCGVELWKKTQNQKRKHICRFTHHFLSNHKQQQQQTMFRLSQILQMPARFNKHQVKAVRQRREKLSALQELKRERQKKLFPQPVASWFNKRSFKELMMVQQVKEYYQKNGLPKQ